MSRANDKSSGRSTELYHDYTARWPNSSLFTVTIGVGDVVIATPTEERQATIGRKTTSVIQSQSLGKTERGSQFRKLKTSTPVPGKNLSYWLANTTH